MDKEFLEFIASSLNTSYKVDSLYESKEEGSEPTLKGDYKDTIKKWIKEEKTRISQNQHGRGLKSANASWQSFLNSTFEGDSLEGEELKDFLKAKAIPPKKVDNPESLDWESIKKLPNFSKGFNSELSSIKESRDNWKEKAEKAILDKETYRATSIIKDKAYSHLQTKQWLHGKDEKDIKKMRRTMDTLLNVEFQNGSFKVDGDKILVVDKNGQVRQNDSYEDITFSSFIEGLSPFSFPDPNNNPKKPSSKSFRYTDNDDPKKTIVLPSDLSASEFTKLLEGKQGEERQLLLKARREQLDNN